MEELPGPAELRLLGWNQGGDSGANGVPEPCGLGLPPNLNSRQRWGVVDTMNTASGVGVWLVAPKYGKGEPCHPYRPPLSQEASWVQCK